MSKSFWANVYIYTPRILLCSAALTAMLAFGIGVGQDVQKERQQAFTARQPTSVAMFVDPLTGCHYIGTTSGDAFFPRMDKDGKQVCTELTAAKDN